MKLTFFGASQTVTGSKSLVEIGDKKILVDCGLFQGHKNLRLRNWDRPPFNAKEIDAVILTHAHLDHSGYLPALVKNGFKGPIFCTAGTAHLSKLILMDSAKIQEEDAAYANRKGFSKHQPALALYTTEDVEQALSMIKKVEFEKEKEFTKDISFTFYPAGHIIGSSFVKISHQSKSICFSGDLGRDDDELMNPPAQLPECDALVLESTYGDREHTGSNPEVEMAKFILEVFAKGGEVIIPAFAVGRTQKVIYHINELMKNKVIPKVPLYMDSPMGINASEIFCRFHKEHKLNLDTCHLIFDKAIIAKSQQDSINIGLTSGPKIVISSSGMATGGRVLHHLRRALPNKNSGVLFSGYQAGGTRGARILNGEATTKIHGMEVPVQAKVANIDSMSAHADASQLLDWVAGAKKLPQKIFLNHGEEHALQSLKHSCGQQFSSTETIIAKEFESYEI